MITALGGGIIRDILIDALPPATFSDWRYLAVAAGGGLITFLLGRRLNRLASADHRARRRRAEPVRGHRGEQGARASGSGRRRR